MLSLQKTWYKEIKGGNFFLMICITGNEWAGLAVTQRSAFYGLRSAQRKQRVCKPPQLSCFISSHTSAFCSMAQRLQVIISPSGGTEQTQLTLQLCQLLLVSMQQWFSLSHFLGRCRMMALAGGTTQFCLLAKLRWSTTIKHKFN